MKQQLIARSKLIQETKKTKNKPIESPIKTDPKTGLPDSILSCVPYTYVPSIKFDSLSPHKIDQYALDFKHKNNTYSTYLANKELKVEVQNAFLSSKFVNFYAIASLHELDLEDKSKDHRYFSKQLINLELWKQRDKKLFLIAINMLVLLGIGVFLALFTFIGLRK
jgi:hypothetical protein